MGPPLLEVLGVSSICFVILSDVVGNFIMGGSGNAPPRELARGNQWGPIRPRAIGPTNEGATAYLLPPPTYREGDSLQAKAGIYRERRGR